MDIRTQIEEGKTALGIEFGSTRIKAVLVGADNTPLASGSHEWENRLEGGIWTYSLDDIHEGLRDCYARLAEDVGAKYDLTLKTVGSMGISAMMHGYMAFDAAGKLLVPFRTWRNNCAAPAAEKLSALFGCNIPARWSVAHLVQAVLNGEPHVPHIARITTLAGYIHSLLTGENVIGIGEASGMFPVDPSTKGYDARLCAVCNGYVAEKAPLRIEELLPRPLLAGEEAGRLTEAGARFLDPTGNLRSGIPFCPPEGDAGTGMVATNAVRPRTGNVSAGTSVFAMIVLERELSRAYPEIDLVTTPVGDLVGMVHCNNCTSDLNAWVRLFGEFSRSCGRELPPEALYEALFRISAQGEEDCGGLLAYNYVSNENITRVDAGRPLFVRTEDARMNLANFMRAQLYAAFATLKIGCDLLNREGVRIERITGHGGIFKTEGVAQGYLAAALGAPVTVMQTAGEGGAWGMAVLANYLLHHEKPLAEYLETEVFAGQAGVTVAPDPATVAGFDRYMERYRAGLPVVREAVKDLK